MQSRILTATIAALLSLGAVAIHAEDKPKADAPSAPKETREQHAGDAVESGVITGSGKLAPGTPLPPGGFSTSGSIHIGPGMSGKAIVTIEVNGKREVREIDLGNATEVKVLPAAGGVVKTKPMTYLGVASEELPEELAAQLTVDPGSGLLVRSVVADSPAEAAGVQRNDVLLQIDGQALTSPKQLRGLITAHKAGDTVKFAVLRKGQRTEIQAKLAQREEPEGAVFEGISRLNPEVLSKALTIKRSAVVVDKNGNVLSLGEAGTDPLKQMADEIDRLRERADAAQKKAAEALQNVDSVGKDAAEAAKKQADAYSKLLDDALRRLHQEVEKADAKKQEADKPADKPQK